MVSEAPVWIEKEQSLAIRILYCCLANEICKESVNGDLQWFPCQGRWKTRPLGRSKVRPYVG